MCSSVTCDEMCCIKETWMNRETLEFLSFERTCKELAVITFVTENFYLRRHVESLVRVYDVAISF